MKNLIGISGKKKSGKDTIGEIIKALCWYQVIENCIVDHISDIEFVKKALNKEINLGTTYEIKKFAEKLKQIVAILIGCNIEDLENEEFKNKELDEGWWYFKGRYENLIPYKKDSKRSGEDLIKPTPRFLLQEIGTSCFRNIIHQNIWINSLFKEYNGSQKWIITDVRFKNEADLILDKSGILIRVERPCPQCSQIGFHKMSCSIGKLREHASETELDNYKNFTYIIENTDGIEELILKVKEILIKEGIIWQRTVF